MQSGSLITLPVITASEPTLIGQGDEEALPPTAVVQITSEADPFMIQIDRNDPSHAMVRDSCLFRSWLTGID